MPYGVIHFLRSVNFENNSNESYQSAIGEMPPGVSGVYIWIKMDVVLKGK